VHLDIQTHVRYHEQMARILFAQGDQRLFIEEAKAKTGLSWDQLAGQLGLCARTLRDWRREKYLMTAEAVEKLSEISGVDANIVDIVPVHWSTSKAGRIGGKKRNMLYGNPGTREGRRAGGLRSQYLRREYPEKYPTVLKRKEIEKPEYSSRLAEFVGIMLGDGHLGQWQAVIAFNTSTDAAYMRFVSQLIEDLFAIQPFVKDRKDHSIIGISSVELVDYLVSIGLVIGNKVVNQVEVPSWIFDDKEYMKACIRGLIDTDGNIARKNYHARTLAMQISFSNRSLPLLQSVRRILAEFDFTPTRISGPQVHLTRRKDVERYVCQIGFSNEKHVKRYQEFLNNAI